MNWIQRQLFTFLIFIGSLFPGSKSIDLGNDYVMMNNTIVPNNLFTGTEIYSKVIEYKFNEKFIIAKQKPKITKHKKLLKEDLITRLMIYDGFLKERNDKDYEKITTPEIIKAIKSDSLIYYQIKKRGLKENYFDKSLKIKNVVDSILQNNSFYKKIFKNKINYWIINKLENTRLGPFTKIEFENEQKRNNINLKLE
ncbi:MAG: hypothetical protein ABI549_01665 [Flavobacterium sp.]|uniref:hypothetical protein n=1 Tax=Flavobacterium sp. TaxID=239 RepID=UPI00326554DF